MEIIDKEVCQVDMDTMVGQVLHTKVREMTTILIQNRAKCSIVEDDLQSSPLIVMFMECRV